MKTVYLSVRLKNYENALALVGAPLAETPENANVLLCPAGDVHRTSGQALNGSENLDEARDARELTLIDNFLCTGKPVIGICHGLQVLNVYFGSTCVSTSRATVKLTALTGCMPSTPRRAFCASCTVRAARSTVHTIRPSGGWGRGFRSSPARRSGTVEAVGHRTLRLCRAVAS